jgi:hypothetical protein
MYHSNERRTPWVIVRVPASRAARLLEAAGPASHDPALLVRLFFSIMMLRVNFIEVWAASTSAVVR